MAKKRNQEEWFHSQVQPLQQLKVNFLFDINVLVFTLMYDFFIPLHHFGWTHEELC